MILLVDILMEYASLAGQTAHHDSVMCIVALHTEGARSGKLPVPSAEYADIVCRVFHCQCLIK